MPDPLLGSRVGPYQIVSLLGEGGMGVVYLAERADEQFHKRVAIKVLKLGGGSTDALRHFQFERQVLAALDHPSIVRLLDAGVTASGSPCVIMDYVEGVPIDRYCAAANLSISQRLRMFLQVCSAVHYAHQRLVVHCDIKPANILVGADEIPKLLDFGIGKLMQGSSETAASAATASGLRAFTPDHASPEQLLGKPVTTATDIHALGLTLYEMLVGHPAYAAATELELVYKVTSAPPEPPSKAAANPSLSPDLDAIILKAMAKDPAARYASVAELAADIQRHLALLPISILSASPRYRVSRFVKRNRMGVAAGVVALFLVAGAGAVTVWQGVIAQRERARAERRFNDVRRLVNVLLFDFYDAASKIPGATELQQRMVKRSIEYLDSLAREASGNVPLAADVLDAYIKFGDIQGNPYQPNLGDSGAALASYQKALDLAAALRKQHPNDRSLARGAARAHQDMADVLALTGKPNDALVHVRKAVELFEQLVNSEPGSTQARIDLASCLESLGDQLGHPGLLSLGNEQEALESYRKSLDNWQAVARIDRANVRARRAGAILSMKIADIQADRGDDAGALKTYREALALAETLPSDLTSRRVVAMLDRKVGSMLGDKRDPAAEQYLRRALAESEALSAADPVNARARLDVATTWNTLAEYYYVAEDTPQALASFGKCADILEALHRSEPANTRYAAQLSDTLLHIGALLAKSGQPAEAAHQTRRGLALTRQLADDPNAPASQLDRAANQFLYCVPEQLRDPRAALAYSKRAVALSRRSDAGQLKTLLEAQEAAGLPRPEILETIRQALSLNPAPDLRKTLEAKFAGFQKQ